MLLRRWEKLSPGTAIVVNPEPARDAIVAGTAQHTHAAGPEAPHESASSASRFERTETYSPTAMDIAPATNPATPAIKTASFDADDAATPIIRLAVQTMASSDPSTAAHNQPERPLRCFSRLSVCLAAFVIIA
jgi:hypothetical protein